MSKQIKRGTYRVTFKDGNQIICGNNYKWWYTHASDYASRKYGQWSTGGTMDKDQLADHVERVEYTDIEFVDDGGLKWAGPKEYQNVIDEMIAKDHKYRTPYSLLKDEFTSITGDRLRLKKEIGRL